MFFGGLHPVATLRIAYSCICIITMCEHYHLHMNTLIFITQIIGHIKTMVFFVCIVFLLMLFAPQIFYVITVALPQRHSFEKLSFSPHELRAAAYIGIVICFTLIRRRPRAKTIYEPLSGRGFVKSGIYIYVRACESVFNVYALCIGYERT